METATFPSSSDHVMKAMKSFLSSPSSSSSSAAANGGVISVSDDCFDDGCSICLEPFSADDPPTISNCKHDYHLHCILEWAQRSTECLCPICCQLLILKDPINQELLEAAKNERSMRSRNNIRIVREDNEVRRAAPYINNSDLEEQIRQHFASVAGRAVNDGRRRRQVSPEIDSSEALPSVFFATMSNTRANNYHDEMENANNGLETGASTSTIEPELYPRLTAENGDGPVNHRIIFGQPLPDGPQRSSSSEFIAFSESVKSKLSAASARYKESITKSTRGFKEKLLARNSTVKELGRGVQREMNAGIAGVARMIERFDLSSKRTGFSVPLSTNAVEKPNLADRGQCLVQNVKSDSPEVVSRGIMHNSEISQCNSTTIPGRVEVSLL